MIQLETGKLYEANNYLYLIGRNGPIGNMICVRISPKRLSAKYDVLYNVQDDNFKLSRRKIKLHRRYKDKLMYVFHADQYGNIPSNSSVEQYLQPLIGGKEPKQELVLS